jgi:hypothetical protein
VLLGELEKCFARRLAAERGLRLVVVAVDGEADERAAEFFDGGARAALLVWTKLHRSPERLPARSSVNNGI